MQNRYKIYRRNFQNVSGYKVYGIANTRITIEVRNGDIFRVDSNGGIIN